MKRIVLLGATGSIGSSVCDVVRTHPEAFRIVALAARSRQVQAERLGREFNARVYCGEDAAVRAVEETEADLVLVATVGLSGLAPTLSALKKGIDVALATKEVMVAAGALVLSYARASGARLIPVDSEHSAIFQCLQGRGEQEIARLTLTASGGPFLDGPTKLDAVTPQQALRHPRWKMGPKVTVDSATMMNKGFEILEASAFFGIPPDRVDVVVHPESVVHSLVTFTDGATLAQLSPPDMRVPIQYALSWPDRLAAERRPLDLVALGALTFRRIDEVRFPCLRLVKDVSREGGVKPAALSAADEVAVSRFLAGHIRFTDIPRLVEAAVLESPDLPCDSVHNILAADAAARRFAQEWKS
ncbi:MAG: 1-deoxy-D-xylulose-5-phosphate reductoisomerase [bacterium]|nr:1-deoxy-D-xylulose-5-phosphate reductoisomerase [bacterium]